MHCEIDGTGAAGDDGECGSVFAAVVLATVEAP